MLQKYNFDGSKKETKEHCPSCKDGEIWLLENQSDRDKYYEDDDASKVFDSGCSVCNTRYLQEKIFLPKELTHTNMVSWRRKIRIEYEAGEDKMLTPEILEQRNAYEETGVCFENKFVSSTVKTFEGKFELQTCLITRKTKLAYNGKVYYDDLSVILNFLASKGMDYQKQQRIRQRQEEQAMAQTISFDDIEEEIVF